MAKERLKSPRVRLFVALDLPAAVQEGIGKWGRRALDDPALRSVRSEYLHVTLAFLGFRPEKEVEEIAGVVAASVGPAPSVELLDPVAKPSLPRARVIALPAVSPGAELLQAGLQERLVAGGFYKPEKRAFWPHVTIARVRPSGRGSRQPMQVERPPEGLPQGLKTACFSRRITLYRSELQPSGARYVPLAQVELPGAGRQ